MNMVFNNVTNEKDKSCQNEAKRYNTLSNHITVKKVTKNCCQCQTQAKDIQIHGIKWMTDA
jgi:hypothetical protein